MHVSSAGKAGKARRKTKNRRQGRSEGTAEELTPTLPPASNDLSIQDFLKALNRKAAESGTRRSPFAIRRAAKEVIEENLQQKVSDQEFATSEDMQRLVDAVTRIWELGAAKQPRTGT